MHKAGQLGRSILPAVACILSGLAVSFVFWPYRTGFLAYIVLIPFVIFSGLREGRKGCLLHSYLFGFAYFMGTLYWIAMLDKEQMTMPWLRLPAATVLCLYLALFMLLMGFVTRRLVLARVPYELALALAWGGVEYLRSLGPLGFPWGSLGYSQTPYPVVTQQAALIGTYGISVWLVLLNALLARLVRPKRLVVLALAAGLFAVPVAGGKLVLGAARSGDTVHLAL
ncbi:MAG TPA: hypothetical protein VMU02_01625, partial [bacterium]|nr:hypothetical protein [bacterium]